LRLTLTPGRDSHSTPDSGASHHATAKLDPDTGYYTMKVDVDVVSNQLPEVWVDHPDGPRSLRVYGNIPPGAPYVTEVAIDDPPLFAALALKAALGRRGIQVDASVTTSAIIPVWDTNRGPELSPDRPILPSEQATDEELEEYFRQLCTTGAPLCRVVAEHRSPPLVDDVVWTLKESQNLHAEMILRRLAYRYGNDPTAAEGSWVVRQWLLKAGLDGDDFVFYDGSGLSAKDLVTPRATAQLLAFAATQPWFAQWKAALPIGGVDGSLEHRFTEPPLKGHVFAKTGTLSESRALSGYLDCASGKQVIFSILVDNHTPGTSADRAVMDKIVAAIAATE